VAQKQSAINHLIRKHLREAGGNYSQLSREIKLYLAKVFEDYAEPDGTLSYTKLAKYKRLDHLKDEIDTYISKRKTLIDNTTRRCMGEIYKNTFKEEIHGVKAVLDRIPGYREVPPIKFPKEAIQSDLSGLTLNERLRAHRGDIIRRINTELTQGIHRGDPYSTMARNISDVIEGDFVKATRIMRTEGHRVTEAARYDVLEKVHKDTPYKMMKKWVSSRDERVRGYPGGKYPNAIARHDLMDKQTVPIDEDFYNEKTGGKGPYPGALGVAEDDINCRCTVVYTTVIEDKEEVVVSDDEPVLVEPEPDMKE